LYLFAVHLPLLSLAAAAQIQRKFFYFFARFLIDHELAYRYPPIVAGVRVVLVGRWVWLEGTCGKVIHVNLLLGWPASGELRPSRGGFLFDNTRRI
jgi:hypothetical protein